MRRRSTRRSRVVGFALTASFVALLGGLAPSSAGAAVLSASEAQAPAKAAAGPILDLQVVARGQVDNCFSTVGGPQVAPDANGKCPRGTTAQINQSYVWSAVRSGDFAYFGTGSNIVCPANAMFQMTSKTINRDVVCEEELGPRGAAQARFGDMRSPRVIRINSDTQESQDVTPDDPNLDNTMGLRGGLAHDDVVLLTGPVIDEVGTGLGMGMFAWEGSTGRYLGSTIDPRYTQMRAGLETSDGEVYAAARTTGPFNGLILKWTGDKENPFQFEEVGFLPGNEGAYLTEHEGRIAVAGWAFFDMTAGVMRHGPAKVWLGPELREGGLTAADRESWEPIFSYADYDPDPTAAKTVDFGELVSWRGELYVGTMQYNTVASTLRTAWADMGQPASFTDRLDDVINYGRAATIFKFSNVGGGSSTPAQKVTLLYGDQNLPVYDQVAKKWTEQPNKLGQKPALGAAGFGNVLSYYAWRVYTFNDRLYFGTFDSSGLLNPFVELTKELLDMPWASGWYYKTVAAPLTGAIYSGGELWRMDSPDKPAVAESVSGYGNYTNHGVRSVVSFEDKGFYYIGTANSYNMHGTGSNLGGFEIIKASEGKPRLPLFVPTLPRSLERWGAFAIAVA